VLAGVVFSFEGVVLTQHSRLPRPPIELKNPELKSYVRDFSTKLRVSFMQYKKQLEEIKRQVPPPGLSQEDNDSFTSRNADDYKKLYLEETEAFKGQYLFQSKLLQNELLNRLGPKYPEALYPPGDSRRAFADATKLMLVDGTLVGPDPISNIGNYLEELANSLP
jgi:hypothetical protein